MKNNSNRSARLQSLRMAENAARSAFGCSFDTAEAFEAKRVEEWRKSHRFSAWIKRFTSVRMNVLSA